MFTGIVQSVGTITTVERTATDARVHVDSGQLPLDRVGVGDSICVSGACLTVTALSDHGFAADVSRETLACTTLGEYGVGQSVNLEPSLTLSTPLGGHLMSGHVDGVGTVLTRVREGASEHFRIQVPGELARFVCAKGSVCVDGVSLTVNGVEKDVFDVQIIPHTLAQTTLADFSGGRRVNIEVDLMARYVERLLTSERQQAAPRSNITREFLKRHGYL